MMKSSV